uniref:Uncharacterized protein n=1 Tax=viral metagenome TaxID=1070528 RepID=A0A6C0J2T8_9ZZZZ
MNNHIKLLNQLCDIYEDRLIYRTIIVTDNINDSINLYNILENADYSVLIVNKLDNNINYNEVDKRIVLITRNKFKNFIKYLNNTFGIANSYNLVLFSYNIDTKYTYKLNNYYKDLTKNITNIY